MSCVSRAGCQQNVKKQQIERHFERTIWSWCFDFKSFSCSARFLCTFPSSHLDPQEHTTGFEFNFHKHTTNTRIIDYPSTMPLTPWTTPLFDQIQQIQLWCEARDLVCLASAWIYYLPPTSSPNSVSNAWINNLINILCSSPVPLHILHVGWQYIPKGASEFKMSCHSKKGSKRCHINTRTWFDLIVIFCNFIIHHSTHWLFWTHG